MVRNDFIIPDGKNVINAKITDTAECSNASYVKLTSPITGFLPGAASYPAMHMFESYASCQK
jgi:hypothetical protein